MNIDIDLIPSLRVDLLMKKDGVVLADDSTLAS